MTNTGLLVGVDRLYPQTSIDIPDDVLLEMFDFYLGEETIYERDYYDGWQTLIHVCQRWRCIVFASPRRLGLILYITPKQSVNSKMLKIWPELPIFIKAINVKSKKDVTNIIGALRHHN
jgi:hypothetical protein